MSKPPAKKTVTELTPAAQRSYAEGFVPDAELLKNITQEQAMKLLVRVAHGESLKKICDDSDMPAYWSVMRLLHAPTLAEYDFVQEFRSAMQAARDARVWALADELIEIADTATNRDTAAAAKVRLSPRYFLLERWLPKQFAPSTRVPIEGTGSPDEEAGIKDANATVERKRAERQALASGKSEP